MRFSVFSLLAAVVTAGRGVAAFNQTSLDGLLNELTALNLTALVGFIKNISDTPSGTNLFNNLTSGESFTLLAPNDEAWAAPFSAAPGWLNQALAYHTIIGHVNRSDIPQAPGTRVYQTLLRNDTNIDDPVVWLHPNDTQNINFNIDAQTNKVIVSNQDKYFPEVLSNHTYQNIEILTISSVVDLPPALHWAIYSTDIYPWARNLTTLATSAEDVLNNVTNTPLTTFFAPTDEAFMNAAMGNITSGLPATNGSLDLSSTEWETLVKNHAIFGQVVFSDQPGDYRSGAEEMITVGKGGRYGHQVYYKGQVKANIIRADIVTQSGVLHIIDTVLPNLARDPSGEMKMVAAEPAQKRQAVEEGRVSSRFWAKKIARAPRV